MPDFPISIYHNGGTGEVLTLHCHGDFEILRVSSGTCVFRIGGESLHAQPGDILFVNPYEFHFGAVEPGESVTYEAIVYERHLLEPITLHADYNRFIRPLLEGRLRLPHRLEPATELARRVGVLIGEILSEYHEKPLGFEWMIRTNLEKIVVLLTRHQPEGAGNRPLSAEQRLGRDLAPLFARIAENPAAPLSTREAAALVRMSPYHFCRRFKSFSGQPFLTFLNRYRINEAERLLRSTDLTITEIAERVGFCNIHYFDRVFRACRGLAPSRLREADRTNEACRTGVPVRPAGSIHAGKAGQSGGSGLACESD